VPGDETWCAIASQVCLSFAYTTSCDHLHKRCSGL